MPPAGEEGEAGGKEPAAPGPSAAFRLLVTRREPAVKLQYAVSGLEPLAWSEDHRVSVSTARSIAVLELICDVHNPGQDLVIHRTSVPAPLSSCLLKVSPQPRGPSSCCPPCPGGNPGPRPFPSPAAPGFLRLRKRRGGGGLRTFQKARARLGFPDPALPQVRWPGCPLRSVAASWGPSRGPGPLSLALFVWGRLALFTVSLAGPWRLGGECRCLAPWADRWRKTGCCGSYSSSPATKSRGRGH